MARTTGFSTMRAFLEHTKCPPPYVDRVRISRSSGVCGFFGLEQMRLYGRASARTAPRFATELAAVDSQVVRNNGSVTLPFDPDEVIENLRFEKYVGAVHSEAAHLANRQSLTRRAYYALRPLFPVPLRRVLQRRALQDWATIPFPAWPVDTTVDDLITWLWLSVLEASGEKEIPFIWYWPDGHQSCAIMTHDVETDAGQRFCQTMLAIEREYGIKSSFEIVPEVRYKVSDQVLDAIRQAGSEVCVHGLNHDGRLFWSEHEFRRRAKAINQYAVAWGASGFRSPVMYRNLAWYDAFCSLSYDMSVPNVAHLDPQRGGCCTIFPFFVGEILELPLTTIQDYPLYNILKTDALAVWRRQLDVIITRHGLASFIIHPDYTIDKTRQHIYRGLLQLLVDHRQQNRMWLALPREVDAWWRDRHAMTLERTGGKWSIHGKGSERATIAYARRDHGNLTFVLPDAGVRHVPRSCP